MQKVTKHNFVESARVLFDCCVAIRMRYREDYDKLTKNYEERKKQLDKDFIGTRLTAEREKLRKEYNDQVNEIRSKAREFIGEQIRALRDYELRRPQIPVDDAAIRQLDALSKVPLSRTELEAITNQYGEKNYWVDRRLLQLAEENGMDSTLTFISADSRMRILSDITEQLEMALSYTGTKGKFSVENAEINAALMPNIMQRAEALYLYGRKDTLSSDSSKVKRSIEIASVLGADNPVLAAEKLESSYKYMTQNARNALLLKLATENSVSKTVVNLCSFANEVSKIRNEIDSSAAEGKGQNLIDEYRKAELIGAEVLNMDNVEQMTKRIESAKGNRYLLDLLQSAEADGNSVLSESLNHISANSANELINRMVTHRRVVSGKATPEEVAFYEETKVGEALESANQ